MTAIEQVIQKAIAFDHGDARRIHHFLKVYAYADTIGGLQKHVVAAVRRTDTEELINSL